MQGAESAADCLYLLDYYQPDRLIRASTCRVTDMPWYQEPSESSPHPGVSPLQNRIYLDPALNPLKHYVERTGLDFKALWSLGLDKIS